MWGFMGDPMDLQARGVVSYGIPYLFNLQFKWDLSLLCFSEGFIKLLSATELNFPRVSLLSESWRWLLIYLPQIRDVLSYRLNDSLSVALSLEIETSPGPCKVRNAASNDILL